MRFLIAARMILLVKAKKERFERSFLFHSFQDSL
jgi:hypothetical protein